VDPNREVSQPGPVGCPRIRELRARLDGRIACTEADTMRSADSLDVVADEAR
jgi:hypothetical protein